ncbi:restriction endonuclease [Streptomyces sp. NPDC005438]|uniref:restriction endonuclease n=1 Tax=Streptomyces sp. NPDC005438 TaxID=3156880 RepID=UPI0033B25965
MSRRPRRRPARRPARRQDRALAKVGGPVGLVLLVVLGFALLRWLLDHWWVPLLAVLLVGAVALMRHRRAQREAEWQRARERALRLRLHELDRLDHREFEFAIRDLMRRDGCRAERLGGAGDDACDVRATDPQGRVWAIQCKHRRDGERGSAVGVGVLQQVNGTARQVHGADVAVVLTNGRFTSKAVPWGRQHRIHLVDRWLLGEWASGSRPLWELLHRIPTQRGPTPLS